MFSVPPLRAFQPDAAATEKPSPLTLYWMSELWLAALTFTDEVGLAAPVWADRFTLLVETDSVGVTGTTPPSERVPLRAISRRVSAAMARMPVYVPASLSVLSVTLSVPPVRAFQLGIAVMVKAELEQLYDISRVRLAALMVTDVVGAASPFLAERFTVEVLAVIEG